MDTYILNVVVVFVVAMFGDKYIFYLSSKVKSNFFCSVICPANKDTQFY